MPLTLTDAQIDTIKTNLFLFQDPHSVLPKPANTDDLTTPTNLAARMNPIGTDPRWADVSIGVVDFTADRMNPRIWLQKGDVPWRMGSSGKIAALLAAVQLRDDVRKVKATNIVSTPEDLDELFATIWAKSKDSWVREIADKRGSPRVSTIFDVTKASPDFFGADVALDKQKLKDLGHMKWSDAPTLSVWERLWLMCARSDNVAASSCICEIGVAYIKAVQRGYGLFDEKRGMRMLLAAGYSGVNTKIKVNAGASAPMFRSIRNTESTFVTDVFINKDTKEPSHSSTQAASVAALTAYMITLMQDKFIGVAPCDTMRTHLADHTSLTTTSLIWEGVNALPGVSVTRAHTKLGILGALRCEFAYIEAAGLRYAVLAMGILPKKVGTTRFDQKQQGRDLGGRIHTALAAA